MNAGRACSCWPFRASCPIWAWGTRTEYPTTGRSAMGKKSTSRRGEPVDSGRPGKLKTKEYEKHMRLLHGELVAMQEWVKASGARIVIVFEGRDTAGKGGTIKRITERV